MNWEAGYADRLHSSVFATASILIVYLVHRHVNMYTGRCDCYWSAVLELITEGISVSIDNLSKVFLPTEALPLSCMLMSAVLAIARYTICQERRLGGWAAVLLAARPLVAMKLLELSA